MSVRLHRIAVIMLMLAVGPGCDPEPRPSAPAKTTDKRSLYADPTLVPSRAGERARAELATSGEVERVVGAHPDVESVVASQNGETLVVVAVVDPSVTPAELDALVKPLVPQGTSVSVQTHAKKAPPNTRRGLPMVLAIALVGLGLSAGVWLERYRSATRHRATAARRRR